MAITDKNNNSVNNGGPLKKSKYNPITNNIAEEDMISNGFLFHICSFSSSRSSSHPQVLHDVPISQVSGSSFFADESSTHPHPHESSHLLFHMCFSCSYISAMVFIRTA